MDLRLSKKRAMDLQYMGDIGDFIKDHQEEHEVEEKEEMEEDGVYPVPPIDFLEEGKRNMLRLSKRDLLRLSKRDLLRLSKRDLLRLSKRDLLRLSKKAEVIANILVVFMKFCPFSQNSQIPFHSSGSHSIISAVKGFKKTRDLIAKHKKTTTPKQ